MIRPATPLDAPGICAIWNPVIREGFETFTTEEKTYGSVTAMIRDNPCFLVAENDEEVMGFASFFQLRAGPGYARTMEHTIYVAPAAKGQGTGRTLMDALQLEARRQGVETLWGGCSSANPGSIVFHEKLGFIQGARLERVGHKHGRWLDLILMRKWLNEPPN